MGWMLSWKYPNLHVGEPISPSTRAAQAFIVGGKDGGSNSRGWMGWQLSWKYPTIHVGEPISPSTRAAQAFIVGGKDGGSNS